MTTRISPKNESLAQKLGNLRTPQKEVAAKLNKEASKGLTKFKKDEMSTGIGRKLRDALERPTAIPPSLEKLTRAIRNQNAARNVKGAVLEVLKQVRFGQPLSKAESPRVGANGQMVAPNGDPLIRVKLSEGLISGQGQYALVNPKTNEFYVQNSQGGIRHNTTYNGPLSLPPKARFEGTKFSAAELKSLQKAAAEGPLHLEPVKPTAFPGLDRMVFDQPAPKPGDILSERPLKSEHPFSYYAITLKNDPTHVIIKKVLTGGIVPARPGDGSYSAPISIVPMTASK